MMLKYTLILFVKKNIAARTACGARQGVSRQPLTLAIVRLPAQLRYARRGCAFSDGPRHLRIRPSSLRGREQPTLRTLLDDAVGVREHLLALCPGSAEGAAKGAAEAEVAKWTKRFTKAALPMAPKQVLTLTPTPIPNPNP